MSALHPSLKRRYQEISECLHAQKRQRHNYSDDSWFPPAFWDNLSRIDLTRAALRELDRRNNQVAPKFPSPNQRRCHPVTRGTLARSREKSFPTHSANVWLSHCRKESVKELKRFARGGGPDLSDLRGFRQLVDPFTQAMNTRQSISRGRGRKRSGLPTPDGQSASNTTSTKSTGPYNRHFQQHLIDGGIYPDGYEYPNGRVPALPANWGEITQRLARRRPSLSPSRFREEDFQKFRRANLHAFKENQIMASVIPTIEGNITDRKCVAGGIPFTNLNPLIDDTLVPGNPDLYHGARPEQLDRRIRENLRHLVIPSTQDDLPIAPNFFLAVKGRDGLTTVAEKQACYDGALGEMGMHSLQSFGQVAQRFDNNAHTITSTYHAGNLKIYTIHVAQPTLPGLQREFYMHQLRSFSMTDTAERFREGASAYRELREWAKETRDEAIRQANERSIGNQDSLVIVGAGDEQACSSGTNLAQDESDAFIQLSQTTPADASTGNVDTPDTSSTDPLPGSKISSKRSNRHSNEDPASQRKRPNVSDFNEGRS
ncbi:hypothetical protein HRR83_000393 [Exophiala dermatitidis]|uniref:Uncharacterized protein n=1 Tax=Exophiala dermatitidis TaxID=5970 RepID=A0AAN6F4U2_EXODE|nr:hypothetical protein HRR75_000356 [Exophiala dermatitidis]KAJ4527640.1 hypothetical protein HRR74_000395 [Exophiala dermatitidis]KAJ4528276.1 hypothetical protein HRR73_000899 [Exophiala dermatitidis]KAJ4531219.1 hypothetical protein HRR76_008891 [Exophiala dermatitidis]KAJ4539041.1 hypothetical protein HRR78_007966 [Exophiala dermatitidis]